MNVAKRKPKAKHTPVIRTKKEKLGLANTNLSIKEIRRSLKLGQEFAENKNWPEAVKYLLIAWEAMPDDINILTVLAHALAQLGVREKAIEVLQVTLERHEPTPQICSVMLQMALEMNFNDIALKLSNLLLSMEPDFYPHYVNHITVLYKLERFDEAIEVAQASLPSFPDCADLWNVLATAVRFRDGREASVVFYEEALRLAPNDYKVLGNLAAVTPDVEKAGSYYKRALEANPDNPEPHLGYAFNLMRRGVLDEAWKHYNERFHPRRAQSQIIHYTHKLPEWDGSDLSGKTLFVTAEQGIGDELMFGNFLPFLYERAEQLIIGCDPRLVSIYERRFPNAIVDVYTDRFREGYRYRLFLKIQRMIEAGDLHVDFAVPVASSFMHEWQKPEDIKPHQDGFINADPDRANDFADRINNDGKPVVGFAWSSGITTGIRQGVYLEIDQLGPIMQFGDRVHFVNLMYSDVREDLAKIKDMYGVEIQSFDDVNMKQDIEANLAIIDNCDLVVSSCSAPGIFSLSKGCPTLLMARDLPWWCFGSRGPLLFAKDAELMTHENGMEWSTVLERTVAAMSEKLKLTDKN